MQVPFSEKEIENVLILLNEEKDFEGVRNKLIVELFYSTGMRRSELVNLKLGDVSISLIQDQIKVSGKKKQGEIDPTSYRRLLIPLRTIWNFRDQLGNNS